jgi:nitronate monooxygenase
MWPNTTLLNLLGIELPIIQAPMAGTATVELAAAISAAGGLGSLGLSMATPEEAQAEITRFRALTNRPLNVNFFCHEDLPIDEGRRTAWHTRLAPYRREAGINSDTIPPVIPRLPFNAAMCVAVEISRPEVVSFHFGLPEPGLLRRVKAVGCRVLCSATTVEEAEQLEQAGADAIIAQGVEAGGHRGMFMATNLASQPGTIALVPQVADAVRVPVIAAGGIGDARGIVAAFALGAAGVQMGTAFMACPEAAVSPLHRDALKNARPDDTVLSNVFSGRPGRVLLNRLVRETGPIADMVPVFPTAGVHNQQLRALAEAQGRTDFTPLWSGQAARLGRALPAGEATLRLAREALDRFAKLTVLTTEQSGI